jgi:hypothetical protein
MIDRIERIAPASIAGRDVISVDTKKKERVGTRPVR